MGSNCLGCLENTYFTVVSLLIYDGIPAGPSCETADVRGSWSAKHIGKDKAKWHCGGWPLKNFATLARLEARADWVWVSHLPKRMPHMHGSGKHRVYRVYGEYLLPVNWLPVNWYGKLVGIAVSLRFELTPDPVPSPRQTGL
jgi:hypothetical protein